MANHVINIITVEGEQSEVNRLLNAVTLLSDLTDKMLEGDDAGITEQLQRAAKEKNEIDARLRGHRQRAAVMDRDSGLMQEMFGIIDDHLKCNGGYDVTAVIDRIAVNTDRTLTVRMTNGFEATASI